MAKQRLNLLPRDEFAALSGLHDKNQYLQAVAKQIIEAWGEDFVPLSKDALSRLRRFHMRRSFADLKLEALSAAYIAPRPGFTHHPPTTQAAPHTVNLVDRPIHYRSVHRHDRGGCANAGDTL